MFNKLFNIKPNKKNVNCNNQFDPKPFKTKPKNK